MIRKKPQLGVERHSWLKWDSFDHDFTGSGPALIAAEKVLSLSNSKIGRRVGFDVVKVHSLRVSVPWVTGRFSAVAVGEGRVEEGITRFHRRFQRGWNVDRAWATMVAAAVWISTPIWTGDCEAKKFRCSVSLASEATPRRCPIKPGCMAA